MNDPAASSGVSSSLLVRHSVADTESSRGFWIPAFAGMTLSRQAAGNAPQEIQSKGAVLHILYAVFCLVSSSFFFCLLYSVFFFSYFGINVYLFTI
jgi:hypothetical protein